MKPNLLIVDDEEGVREAMRMALQEDYRLTFAADAQGTLKALKAGRFDLCLLDIMLPDGSGLDLLEQVKRKDPGIRVVMVTALQGVETALKAMKGKAQDYITKPFRVADLLELIPRVLSRRDDTGTGVAEEDPGSALVRREWKNGVPDLEARLQASAKSGKPLWITGEKGLGVEEALREVHRLSDRSAGNFVTLDCSRGAEGLEKELFGDERGGRTPQVGKWEFAQGGALYLEDLDQLPLEIQARLVKVVGQRPMGRGGVLLLASSRTEPLARVEKGALRRDLFVLFGSARLSLPPLRDRKGEVERIARSFVRDQAKRDLSLQEDALGFLVRFPWPGNLAELGHCLQAMVHFAVGDALSVEDIPLDILITQAEVAPSSVPTKHLLKKVNRGFERKYIRRVLEHTRGNQTQAARTLGLHRNTLILKLKELKLEGEYKRIVQKRRASGVGFREL